MNPASVGDPNKEPEIVVKEAKKPIVEETRGKYKARKSGKLGLPNHRDGSNNLS